ATAATHARAVSEYVKVGKEISRITGWENNPSWFGNYGRVDCWMQNGWIPELDIYPTIKKMMAKRGDKPPPKTLSFFEGAIADAFAARTAPVPAGNPNAKPSRKKFRQ
ncbi:MAG: hypothetical protein ACRD4H_04715, partial [Candidatus Acidiferrales bacterium]